jgi:CO/xanthine dehydrogenase Mo-binding subunit
VGRCGGTRQPRHDVPEVLEIELINRPDKPSVGAGEAGTCPLAGAIGNAIFNATGTRLREYPFSPERVKSALVNNGPHAV